MLLENYLEPKDISFTWLLNRMKLNPDEVSDWDVIHYPDELIHILAKVLQKEPSQLFYELLNLESMGQIRKAGSDYSLLKAIDAEATYIYISKAFEDENSKFLTEILIENDLYEPDVHPLARFNRIGKDIYKVFLTALPKSDAYKRIETKLPYYFVLVHDKGGTILCHNDFNQPRRL